MTTTSAIPTVDELEHLLLMATLAPSVHNTQPWRFTPTHGGVLVVRDRTRQLAVIDPYGRQLLLSCGAAVHHLEVAARALGLDTAVHLDLQDDTVAALSFTRGTAATAEDIAAAVAIPHRHTYRGRYLPEPVVDADLDQLRQVVELQGGWLRVVRDSELVGVKVAVSRAETQLERDPAYVAELGRWVWHSPVDEGRSDGLPQDAVDHGTDRAESLVGREYEGIAHPTEPTEPVEAEDPAVVLLGTSRDGPVQWVQAGRALSALLLRATELGLLAQPLGQVIDLPGPRRALADLLGVVGAPQLLLRLGHGTSSPTTPRRPVLDVLNPTS